ncbi:MFS transporter [Bacillus sp. AGMB 02131]|uniref:MFS transporter n=1 Tax=Peribacillus faecalis TaxID=2772559 RepID=A0A927CWD0_9BACI|nr:MFS transporter [Peribacillus faecalis]MBD3108766.1 MFS transporter [Peribacillus faecalis]
MINNQLRFIILVAIVSISGFSQGMLMPLIAIIFEGDGVHSSINGLHATSLYIGVLLASPLMEAPLRRFGYKPLLLVGAASVAIALALFPIWKSFWFWFLLRLIIGIGDHMLHFATQTWITSISPEAKRGRNIAIYGLFFSLGFAFGPMMANMVKIHEAMPFIVSSIITVIAWLAILLLKNEFPKSTIDTSSLMGTFKRFKSVFKYAWVALLPPMGFGFLEASLNGNFPVYALRNGFDVNAVAIILPAFSIGSIIFQMPLGMLSDTYGRNKVLKIILSLGAAVFLVAGFIQGSVLGLLICFGLAGMIVGSTFSLGISYMTDLLPRDLLPAGNLMCGIFFSLGSMIGPFIGGLTIHYFAGGSFFYLLSIMLMVILICMFLFKGETKTALHTQ